MVERRIGLELPGFSPGRGDPPRRFARGCYPVLFSNNPWASSSQRSTEGALKKEMARSAEPRAPILRELGWLCEMTFTAASLIVRPAGSANGQPIAIAIDIIEVTQGTCRRGPRRRLGECAKGVDNPPVEEFDRNHECFGDSCQVLVTIAGQVRAHHVGPVQHDSLRDQTDMGDGLIPGEARPVGSRRYRRLSTFYLGLRPRHGIRILRDKLHDLGADRDERTPRHDRPARAG